MKNILLIITLFISWNAIAEGCYNAESESYDATRDAKKAYRSSELSRCKRYAKKAYRHASYAESEASSCN